MAALESFRSVVQVKKLERDSVARRLEETPFPLVLAPTGFTRIADPQGELAVARAAERAGLSDGLSTMGTRSIEEVAAVSDGPKLSWDDVAWLRSIWDGPIVLKGIQSAADSLLVADAGVDAVALSNHGDASSIALRRNLSWVCTYSAVVQVGLADCRHENPRR